MTNTSGDLVTTASKINKAGRVALVTGAAAAMLVLPALVPAQGPDTAVTPLTLVQPVVAHADGAGHSLIISHKSNDNDTLLVCKDWSGSSNVRSDCPSRFGNLPKGHNTKSDFGWDDTDGIRVPKNKTVMWTVKGPDRHVYTSCGKARWVKVTPTATGVSRKELYIVSAAEC